MQGPQLHEDFQRQEAVPVASERSFGLVFAAVFVVICLLPILQTPRGELRFWALALAVVFGALALLWTAPLRPLARAWHRFGLLLHAVVSPIVMGFLFYVVVTPIALLMRLCGKDVLRLRLEPAEPSYWIRRDPAGLPPDTMKNQF